MKKEVLITSDNLILLFMTLKQIEFLDNNMGEIWSLNYSALSEFIKLNKNNPKYQKILEDFEFMENVSKELIIAINRVKNKHIITTIVDDIIFLSRVNISFSIVNNYDPELLDLVASFIAEFNRYSIDPEDYINELLKVETESKIIEATNTRNILQIQRRIKDFT